MSTTCSENGQKKFHKDQLAKYDLGVKSNEILTNYGYDVTFHKFDGGHKVDRESLKRVIEWINEK